MRYLVRNWRRSDRLALRFSNLENMFFRELLCFCISNRQGARVWQIACLFLGMVNLQVNVVQ